MKVQDSAHRDVLLRLKDLFCEDCAIAKATRKPLPKATDEDKDPHVWHADLKGPLKRSAGGARYDLNLVHPATGYFFLSYIKTKADVLSGLDSLISTANAEGGDTFKVTTVRTDYGTEFVNAEVEALLKTKGVKHERSAPDSPGQNGAAERVWRTVSYPRARRRVWDTATRRSSGGRIVSI